MDDLKTTIDTLTPDQKREFAGFIKRQNANASRKDLELFMLLQQKQVYSPKQLLQKLYPDADNNMAYYALRKRLMRQLSDFIMLQRMEEDTTAAASIMGLFSLARYLFEGQADRLAWNLLRKAEKMAAENEQYDLLNAIYNLQIEKADSEYAGNLSEIIAKRNENKLAADQDERANIAASIIKQRLTEVRLQGSDMEFEKIIRNVLEEYQLTDVMSKRPSLLYKLMTIARSAVLARKDFYQFEPYIIAQYRQAQKAGFGKPHLYYKLSLLYMIAHVLYRNRKFTQSLEYLEFLFQDLQAGNKGFFTQFYPRYIFLLTANYAFTHRLAEASVLMENLLQQHGNTLTKREQLTAQMGLSFLYFAQANFVKANLILMRMPHSDKFCEKKMGREWVLKKNMGELILQIELKNPELALNKLRIIERTYKDLLKQEPYRNVKGFLQLLKALLTQSDLLPPESLKELTLRELEFIPIEQENLQAISFFAWVKARMQKRRYYDVLLELTTSVLPEPAFVK